MDRTSGEIQRVIQTVWADALSVGSVGIHENFFDLGANSLMIAEVHVQLRQKLRREFPLIDLFHFPSVSALAGHLSGEVSSQTMPAAASRAGLRKAAREARSRE